MQLFVVLKINNRHYTILLIYNGEMQSGNHEIRWDGTNMNGEQIGSGIYFIHANIGNKHRYKKVMKLK